MKRTLFFIAFIPFITAYAQDKMPGGVHGAGVWEITKVTQSGQSRWEPKLKNRLDSGLSVRGKIKTINNNPALLFSEGPNTKNSTLNLGNLSSFSMFTVCQEIDTLTEKIILSLENDTAPELALTNRRMAALDVYRYSSYNTVPVVYPEIYSYTQNKSSDNTELSRKLQLGRPPRDQQLPASVYSGIIPEVILFSRAVSPKERQQVESYLALKYGISLNQEFPASYLNSKGEVIWDAEKNADFNRNIAGIGRDDLSDLNQTISESSQTPGLMKIGILKGELKNNSFLIWGDDAGPLRISEDPEMRRMLREWKISTFNFNDPVYLEIDELSLNEINPLEEDEIYWLMVDKSGTGKYTFRKTGFIPCQPLSPKEKLIRFNPVSVDTDGSGSDVFTLLAAPPFFTRSIVQSPACLAEQSGLIQTEIAGGVPPFRLVLRELSGSGSVISFLENRRDHIFEGLSQGGYLLNSTDSENKTFSEEIWVANTHLWETLIKRNYNIIEGESLLLDASEKMPAVNYIYCWSTPDGSLVNSEEITITQPGKYLLSVTDENNCNSITEVNIHESGKSIFRKIELYPNPSGGWFELRMRLERIMDVNIILTDNAGKILKQTLMQNDQYYQYNDIIRKPGIYFITLQSVMEKKTLRLIVQ